MNLVQSASKQLATRICFLIQLHVSSHKGSFIVNIIRFLKCPLQNNLTYSYLSVIIISTVDLGGPVVIILAPGSEVRGFKPGRGRWTFSEHKNPECDFLRKGTKPWAPRRRFTARKRTSNRN